MINEFSNAKTKWRSSICQNEMKKFAYQTRFRSNRSEETSQTNGLDKQVQVKQVLGKQAKGELPKISFLDSNRFRFISFY